MKSNILTSVRLHLTFLSLLIFSSAAQAAPPRQFYQLIVYQLANDNQEKRLDKFLSGSFLPELHQLGIQSVGVYKTRGIDTASDKKMYVLITLKSLEEFRSASHVFEKPAFSGQAGDYLQAPHDDPAFVRKETILMEAFSGMPELVKPKLKGPRSEQVYELRSYESASETLYLNKVDMFNEGEIDIFKNIGSQPVFFGQVLAGSRMPNLMYITAYDNMDSRNEKWKIFGGDPKWKEMSGDPQYKNNMNKADVIYLTPTDYSDI